MFSRFARPFWKRFFTAKKLITASTILAYSLFKTQKTLLDSVVVEETSTDDTLIEKTSVNLD